MLHLFHNRSNLSMKVSSTSRRKKGCNNQENVLWYIVCLVISDNGLPLPWDIMPILFHRTMHVILRVFWGQIALHSNNGYASYFQSTALVFRELLMRIVYNLVLYAVIAILIVTFLSHSVKFVHCYTSYYIRLNRFFSRFLLSHLTSFLTSTHTSSRTLTESW